VEDTLVCKLIDPGAGFKGRIELDQGFGPEFAVIEDFMDIGVDARIVDLNETLNVIAVIPDQLFAKVKDIHERAFAWRNSLSAQEVSMGSLW